MTFKDIMPWDSGHGLWLDKIAKPFIKKGITIMNGRASQVIELKNKEGWCYPEAKAWHDMWNEFIEFFEPAYSKEIPKEEQYRYQMHTLFRDMGAFIMDQDSVYTQEMLVLIALIQRYANEGKFNLEHHMNRPYWDYRRQQAKAMQVFNTLQEPLPIDTGEEAE